VVFVAAAIMMLLGTVASLFNAGRYADVIEETDVTEETDVIEEDVIEEIDVIEECQARPNSGCNSIP
jgi:hypothetical protein